MISPRVHPSRAGGIARSGSPGVEMAPCGSATCWEYDPGGFSAMNVRGKAVGPSAVPRPLGSITMFAGLWYWGLQASFPHSYGVVLTIGMTVIAVSLFLAKSIRR